MTVYVAITLQKADGISGIIIVRLAAPVEWEL